MMDMDTYESFREVLKRAEDTVLLLSQAFEKLADATIRSMENIKEILEERIDCAWKKDSKTPKEYGISLLEKRRKLLPKRYSYVPVHRKHLPYQRRNY